MSDLQWTDEDARAVDVARVLAADAVEQAGSGHPGTPISLAPLAYLLYQHVMAVDPADDKWIGRDRFVLSAGHASVLQYAQLYLGGLGLELDDIKRLRTAGSLTPGHPEYGHTKFVEATTGPLGAGISMAVGMAMAARRERGLYDPQAVGESIFDHYVYAIAGDGCMQEGVQAEAVSLAGVQELGNLIVIYDDNRITIEGETKISFTEDVEARFAACGWDVHHVDWTNGGTQYSEDIRGLYDAIAAAKKVTNKPSLIRLSTIIGWPLPHKAGSASVHGAAIGRAEIDGLKDILGLSHEPFSFDQSIIDYTRSHLASRGKATRAAWDAKFVGWKATNPQQAKILERVRACQLPAGLTVPTFAPGEMSTRKASGKVISELAKSLPELWGGSADLAGSNNTTIDGAASFLPESSANDEWPGNQSDGRVLHFGIREHAMGGALNGINLSGLTRAFGGTFFVFADYMRPAARLASLMGVPSTFVWTHDSIGVGEDGPTHQPVEHLAAYRAIPGLAMVRPADANETAEAWVEILRRHDQPAGIVLTRQNVRTLDRSTGKYASASHTAKGAYVLSEASKNPDVILIATGSEVQVALDAQEKLEAGGIATRVVSMPCWEWFDEQPAEYREQVLPAGITARVSVEAGIAMGWAAYVGGKGASVSLEHFGASAPGADLMSEYGFTADNVAAVARDVLQKQ